MQWMKHKKVFCFKSIIRQLATGYSVYCYKCIKWAQFLYYIQGHLKCVSYIFSRLHSIWISGKLRCRKRHFSTLLIMSLSVNLRFIKKESHYLWLLCINLGFIILNNTSYVSSSHWWYFFQFKSENINPRC